MKTIDMLRPVTLGFVTLLSVSLLPVAHAEHNHDRRDDSVIVSHEIHRDHAIRLGRHEHRHRHESSHYGHHHAYRDRTWRDHPHPVVWQRQFTQPRLMIRLPWLIFVDY